MPPSSRAFDVYAHILVIAKLCFGDSVRPIRAVPKKDEGNVRGIVIYSLGVAGTNIERCPGFHNVDGNIMENRSLSLHEFGHSIISYRRSRLMVEYVFNIIDMLPYITCEVCSSKDIADDVGASIKEDWDNLTNVCQHRPVYTGLELDAEAFDSDELADIFTHGCRSDPGTSCVKILLLACACGEIGLTTVKNYIGCSPPAVDFNILELTPDRKLSNVCSNSGAIAATCLLWPTLPFEERTDKFLNFVRKFMPNVHIDFTVFTHEKSTCHNNRDLAKDMHAKKILPSYMTERTIAKSLELYTMACLLSTTASELFEFYYCFAMNGWIGRTKLLSDSVCDYALASMFGSGIYLESSLWSEVMFLVLVASFLVASVFANLPGSSSDNICYFRNNDVSIQYELTADFNTVKFITSRTDFNISNKYTGLAFGDSMADLDIILVLNDDQGTRFATGHTAGYKSPVMDSTPYVTPQYKNTEKGIFTYIFTRPFKSVRPHMKDLSLSRCTPMHIILEGPVRKGGKIGEHTSKPIKTEICPKHCRVSESWP